MLIVSAILRLRKKLSDREKPSLGTYINELGGYGLIGVLLIVVGAGVVGAKLVGNRTAAAPPQQIKENDSQPDETVLDVTGEPSVGNVANSVYLEAHKLRLAGNNLDAVEAFNRAIEMEPTSAEAYLGRGQAYAALGELELAIADFGKAIVINDTLADAYNERGLVYGNLGQLDRALGDFDQAIRLDSGDQDQKSSLAISYANRGVVHLRLGRPQNAKADFDRALELDATLAEAYYQRAVLHRTVGNLQDSLADLTRTIELEPNHVGALYLRSFIQATSAEASLRNGKQAIDDASQVCELTAWNDAGMIAALAAAYAETGDFANAQKHKDQAITVATPQQADSIRSFLSPISDRQPVRLD
jgi:tetratricopeptide (TPR) repeat protein